MKLEVPQSTIEKSGDFKEVSFKVRMNAKAFKVLSSSLYSNKVQAVLRELGTNAYDSHVAAGKSHVPFNVKLPTRLESTFRIRDYGVGLSLQQLKTIYTTFFESDKDHSNDYTGCLGLGSKSPFSYTDSFSVISYYNGTKYTCIASFDEEGKPTLSFLSRSDTDESNGLQIEFNVRQEDHVRFMQEATNVYRWFKVPPKINCAVPELYAKNIVHYSGTDWVIINNTNHYKLVMGNVAYPLSTKYTSELGFLNSNGLIIYANIGEVDFVASREALEYTKRTEDFLQKKMQVIKDAVSLETEAELQKCDSYIGACKYYYHHEIFFTKVPSWRGKAVYRSLALTSQNIFYARYGQNLYPKYYKETHERNIDIDCEKYGATVIVINDLERGAIARLKQYCDSTGMKGYLVSQQDYDNHIVKCLDDIGFDKTKYVILASQLDKVKYNRTPALYKSRVFAFNTKYQKRYRQRECKNDWWIEKDASNITEGYYVKLDGFDPDVPNYQIKRLIEALSEDIPDIKDKVFGVRKREHSKICDNPKFLHLTDLAKSIVMKYNNVIELVKKRDVLQGMRLLGTLEDGQIAAIQNTDVLNIISAAKEFKKHEDVVERILSINSIVNAVPIDTNNPEREAMLTAIGKYPMLQYWYANGMPWESSVIAHYFSLLK